MDRISVIVPVYNSEKYLPGCVNSIQHQTFSNLEIILVDDGSNDASGLICDQIAENDARVRVIHKKNAGVSAARNDGLEIATGDWISFVDSDDQLEPDMYEFLLTLAKDNNAQISHCGYKRLSEDGTVLKEVSGTHQILMQNSAEAIQCMLEGRYFVGGLWNKLFSNKVLKGLRFCTSLKNNEDILFNALAFQNADCVIFADETKYLYYEHGSSACNQLSQERQLKDSVLAASTLCDKSLGKDTLVTAKKWLFDTNMRLYRHWLLTEDSTTEECIQLKNWLKSNYSAENLTRRGKSNFYLMIYFGKFYKLIYKVYDAIRKPNWDVK